MRVFLSPASGLLALFLAPAVLHGQWPGQVRGHAVDAVTGRTVPVVDVRLEPGPVAVRTDAGGAFLVRGLEPGRYRLHLSALGYRPGLREIVVENGAILDVVVPLDPVPVAIEGMTASVSPRTAGAIVVEGAALAATGAGSVGDALASVPGVVVTESGRGGRQVPSIRGSGADAVLVLVDGVPLNDPVTGEADLSTVSAASVASLTVLPGGGSVRWGAGAEGGVILIRTGGDADEAASVTLGAGSLGERRLSARVQSGVGPDPAGSGGDRWEAGVGYRNSHGRFDFVLPPQVGGGSGTRQNADFRMVDAHGAWTRTGEAGSATLGVSAEEIRRGLPGRSYAPSLHARQETRRVRAHGAWELRTGLAGRTRAAGHLVRQRTDFSDPEPPFGFPFDDRTTFTGWGGEVAWEGEAGASTRLTAGLSGSRLQVRSTALETDGGAISGPPAITRTDAGVRLAATRWWGGGGAPAPVTLTAGVRLDRSGIPSGWYLSHDVALGARLGGFDVRVGQRSSFSPPTLGDQFFREGVGVAPNPDLEAERVPWEWVAGVATTRTVGPARVSLDVEGYRGDIRGMILWLPDFRFVWSPRNHDVRRRGVEGRGTVSLPGRGVDLSGHVAWNRVTYARAASPDVQVAYRPRWTGGASAGWRGGAWSLALGTDFTGARYPVPNAVNELPGFWTTRGAVSRGWEGRFGAAEVNLEVRRAFDHDDTLIFAFPDPGRTLALRVRLVPGSQ